MDQRLQHPSSATTSPGPTSWTRRSALASCIVVICVSAGGCATGTTRPHWSPFRAPAFAAAEERPKLDLAAAFERREFSPFDDVAPLPGMRLPEEKPRIVPVSWERTFRDLEPKILRPRNDRDWAPDMERPPWAEFNGDYVHVHNIRFCDYRTEEDFTTRYYDRAYRLSDVETVDFIVVPFSGMDVLAHTMLSFGFRDGTFLCCSVEIRKEKGEKYGVLGGVARQFELIYLLGDERDLIPLRTNYRRVEVFIYRTIFSPEQSRDLLVDILQRANKLHDEPEFYHTLTNNCTTNLVNHFNNVMPGTIPYGYQVLFPGLTEQLFFARGLLVDRGGFRETKAAAKVNYKAYLHRDARDFSNLIRR